MEKEEQEDNVCDSTTNRGARIRNGNEEEEE